MSFFVDQNSIYLLTLYLFYFYLLHFQLFLIILVLHFKLQIRHNALESARVMIVQTLDKQIGKGGDYFVKIRIFPHHVLRENALATGAGADRFQKGMRQSFGKPTGTAAQVKKGQKMIEVRVDDKHENVGRTALKKASYKLPTKCRIVVE